MKEQELETGVYDADTNDESDSDDEDNENESDDDDGESVSVDEVEINGVTYYVTAEGEVYNTDSEQVGEKPNDMEDDAEPCAEWLW